MHVSSLFNVHNTQVLNINQGFKIYILPCHFCQLPLLIILLCEVLQCIQKQINLKAHVTNMS